MVAFFCSVDFKQHKKADVGQIGNSKSTWSVPREVGEIAMRLRPRNAFIFALLISGGFLTELQSQTTTSGALAGVVTDQSNALIPDATVVLKDRTRGTAQATKTDRRGVYRFFFLVPGRYSLTVTHSGFREQTQTVAVVLGPAVSVNISLAIAEMATRIQVTAERPLIQAENGDFSATILQKQVSELPNPGNDLTYIVQSAPGVVMNTDVQGGANFSILGMPGFSYLHTLDGMNDNDNAVNLSQVGALILLLGQNQIQEASVVSTGYSGQFGGAAGGNVNYVTKSGSNQIHGNAQYYWNGRILNANNWFNNAFNEPRPFSIANQWAGSVGGSIKKDKFFFFFDTEGLRLLIPQHFLVTIPSLEFEAATISNIDAKFGATSASDVFYKKIFKLYDAAPGRRSTHVGANPTDPLGCSGFSDPLTGLGIVVACARYFFSSRSRASQDTLTSGRLDWNVTAKDRAFFRLQYDHGVGAIANDPISPIFDQDFTQPWWQAQVLETHTFGTSAANQFLLAGSYFAGIYQVRNPSQALAAFPTTLGFGQAPFNSLGGGANFTVFGFGRYNTQYQISDDIAKIQGAHKLGFGANFERIYWSELPSSSSTIGHLNVQTLRAFLEGGVDRASPAVDFTTLSQSFTSPVKLPISFLNLGIYANDEWRVLPNLTLTLALRAEHYANPSCRSRCFARLASPFASLSHDPNQPYNQVLLVNQKQAFAATDNILWSPRFSFAWQPFGVHRNSVLRGGVGVFFDSLPGRLADSFSSNPPLLNSYTVVGNNLAPGETVSLFKDAASSNTAFINGFAAGKTLAQIQASAHSFFPPAISDPGKRTHSPRYQRWNWEWQQGIGIDTSVSIGYFGHHGTNGLRQDPNLNAFGFGSLPAGRCSSPVPSCAPDPRFSQVTEIQTNTVSNYNGTLISFRRRFSRGSQGVLQANYTYGHALDEVSTLSGFIFTGASLMSAQDPNNLHGSYGSADHDVRHSFTANYVWELPVKALLRGHGWGALVQGWQLSGTVFARSGFPYTVFDYVESDNLVTNNYFGLVYAVPAHAHGVEPACGQGAAIPLSPKPCLPPQVLADGSTPNPNAVFVQATCETGFNSGTLPSPTAPCGGQHVSFAQGRNRFRGPGYVNTDLSILKNTRLPGWNEAVVGIGLQFFNLFNHPNFGFPDPGLSSPLFGQIETLEQPPTSLLGSGFGGDASARMIQLKVQLTF
jgi:hypothetical protein